MMADSPGNPPGGTSGKHGRKSHHSTEPKSLIGSFVAGVAAFTGMEVEDTIDSVDATIEEVPVHNNTSKTGNTNCVDNLQTDIRHIIIKCCSEAHTDAFRNLDAWATSDELEKLGLENVKQCKPLMSGGLLIEENSLEEVKFLLNIKTFCSYNVTVELAEMIGIVRGVIYDRRLITKDVDYILEKLRPQGVVKVRPLSKVIDNNRQRTPLLVLSFREKTLPESIKIGHEYRSVRPYRIRPSQCKKCHRFGHWADACTRVNVCVKCGTEGARHGNDCALRTKCCLCGGPHKADNETCPVWVRQLKICEIRTDHQLSYSRAAEVLKRKEAKKYTTPVGESWGPSLVADSERIVLQSHPTWVNQKQKINKTQFEPKKTSTTFSDSSDEETQTNNRSRKRNRNTGYKPNKSFKQNQSDDSFSVLSQVLPRRIHKFPSNNVSTSFDKAPKKAVSVSTSQSTRERNLADTRNTKKRDNEADDENRQITNEILNKAKSLNHKVIYVKDIVIQCVETKSIGTQTPTQPKEMPAINGLSDIAALMKCIVKTTTVNSETNRPIYDCKPIAQELSKLTGYSINAEWVLSSFA